MSLCSLGKAAHSLPGHPQRHGMVMHITHTESTLHNAKGWTPGPEVFRIENTAQYRKRGQTQMGKECAIVSVVCF